MRLVRPSIANCNGRDTLSRCLWLRRIFTRCIRRILHTYLRNLADCLFSRCSLLCRCVPESAVDVSLSRLKLVVYEAPPRPLTLVHGTDKACHKRASEARRRSCVTDSQRPSPPPQAPPTKPAEYLPSLKVGQKFPSNPQTPASNCLLFVLE